MASFRIFDAALLPRWAFLVGVLNEVIQVIGAFPANQIIRHENYNYYDDNLSSSISTPPPTTPSSGSGGNAVWWTNFLSTIIIWVAILFACSMCCKGLCRDWYNEAWWKYCRCCHEYRPFKWCCKHPVASDNPGNANSAFEADGEIFTIPGRFDDDPPVYEVALHMPRPPKDDVDAEVIEMNVLNRTSSGTLTEVETDRPTTSGVIIQGASHTRETDTDVSLSGSDDDPSAYNPNSRTRVVVHRMSLPADPDTTSYYSVDSQLPSYDEALVILENTDGDDTAPEYTSLDGRAHDDIPPRYTSLDDTTPGDTSPNETAPIDTTSGDTSPNETAPIDTTSGDTSGDETAEQSDQL